MYEISHLLHILEHISGFSGSAGTAVITLDEAALSTDGRYFNQASKQLDSNWHLLKQGLEDVPTWQEWYTTIIVICSVKSSLTLIGRPSNPREVKL